jgi:F-type H+-transporting ATPase subunit alpha
MGYFEKDFQAYLDETKEVGFVDQVVHSIIYATGLPSARPNEIVIFESGSLGKVLSLTQEYVEVLSLDTIAQTGERVARTNKLLEVPVGEAFLGKIITPLGELIGKSEPIKKTGTRFVDTPPMPILKRQAVNQSLETGVSLVDLSMPLGKGQRELVLGDRDAGKTRFLMQVILNQAKKGTICIYAGIAKKKASVKRTANFFAENGIEKNTIIISATAQDPAGIIYLAPYTAMTHAEYFRDKGKDCLVVLDDLTAHAKFYREITLLLQRFPGRSSYPGDIFYTHARLLERAGSFEKAAITCLPVADTILGDMSGFIQTNLMAMTDGHIFFDIDLFNQGRRPAINPFLSVTRVGLQAQAPLVRELSRNLNSFLVEQDKLRQFMHFGAELSEEIQRKLSLGDKIYALFGQPQDTVIPLNVSIYLLCCLWAGIWRDKNLGEVIPEFEKVKKAYGIDQVFKQKLDQLVSSAKDFKDLISRLKTQGQVT